MEHFDKKSQLSPRDLESNEEGNLPLRTENGKQREES